MNYKLNCSSRNMQLSVIADLTMEQNFKLIREHKPQKGTKK